MIYILSVPKTDIYSCALKRERSLDAIIMTITELIAPPILFLLKVNTTEVFFGFLTNHGFHVMSLRISFAGFPATRV